MRVALFAIAIAATTTTGCGRSGEPTANSNGHDFPEPVLPSASYSYSDAENPFPPYFRVSAFNQETVAATDNTPASNPITNAGATLGRVLFYDVRLSANNSVSCSSCHQQAFGFGDTARFSRGFNGGRTARHAMGLTNIRFHKPTQFFGDRRASTLEDAVLLPIQDSIEMGSKLADVVTKLGAIRYYPALFQAAFGTPEVTTDRMAKALAQFLRSVVSVHSKFDRAIGSGTGPPNFAGVFTAEELTGERLFDSSASCFGCHRTLAHISTGTANDGLDLVPVDTGAGCGGFKVASLRNVAVRPPYMHDGRFATLEQVIEHYDTAVKTTVCLDQRLRNDWGVAARRLNLTQSQRNSLVAFLKTLTDSTVLTAAKFSNPFPAK